MSINLKGSPFSVYTPPLKKVHSLFMTTSGHEKHGKTTFAFSMPTPLAVITLDHGTQQILENERRKGRNIVDLKIGFERDLDKKDAEEQWKLFKRAVQWMIDEKEIRSGLIDTGSAMYELARMAEFGSLTKVGKGDHTATAYMNLNMKLDSIMYALRSRPLNVVFTHKMKKRYVLKPVRNKATGLVEDKDGWDGGYEVAAYSQMGYHADVIMQHGFADGQFNAKITGVPRGCGPDMADFFVPQDLLTFPLLAGILRPEADPGDWEDR